MTDRFVIYTWMNNLNLTFASKEAFAVIYQWCEENNTTVFTAGTKYIRELTGLSIRGMTACMKNLVTNEVVTFKFNGRRNSTITLNTKLIGEKSV